jgi:hypothetical protein
MLNLGLRYPSVVALAPSVTTSSSLAPDNSHDHETDAMEDSCNHLPDAFSHKTDQNQPQQPPQSIQQNLRLSSSWKTPLLSSTKKRIREFVQEPMLEEVPNDDPLQSKPLLKRASLDISNSQTTQLDTELTQNNTLLMKSESATHSSNSVVGEWKKSPNLFFPIPFSYSQRQKRIQRAIHEDTWYGLPCTSTKPLILLSSTVNEFSSSQPKSPVSSPKNNQSAHKSIVSSSKLAKNLTTSSLLSTTKSEINQHNHIFITPAPPRSAPLSRQSSAESERVPPPNFSASYPYHTHPPHHHHHHQTPGLTSSSAIAAAPSSSTVPSLATPAAIPFQQRVPSNTDTRTHSHHHSHHQASSTHHTNPTAAPSKLTLIMKRYLKLQHSHCKHPISTLPMLSLQKPHVCAKPPPPSFHNIANIVHRYYPLHNSQYLRRYRYDVQAGYLQHLYSSYRSIQNFIEDEENTNITTIAFGQERAKIWLAYNTLFEGPHVSLFNLDMDSYINEYVEIESADHHCIDAFVFPHRSTAVSNNVMVTMMRPMDNDHRYTNGKVGAQLWLYRDQDNADVFASPCLRSYRFQPEQFQALVNQNNTNNQPNIDLNNITEDQMTLFLSATFSNATGQYLGTFLANNVLENGVAVIFDVETGAIVQSILNEATTNHPVYRHPKITYMIDEDNIFMMDGKLYDLRANQIIHRFDKLSDYGNTFFHPNGHDVVIDTAVWDLRTLSLRLTIPLIDQCRLMYDPFGHGLIAAQSMKDDTRGIHEVRQEYQSFHILNPHDYSHVHTQLAHRNTVTNGQNLLADLHVDDRNGNGLLAGIILMGAENNITMSCRVWEIGMRKGGGEDEDDDDLSDDDDDWNNDDDDDEDDDEEDDDDEDDDDDDHTHSEMDEDEEDDDDEMETVSSEEEEERRGRNRRGTAGRGRIRTNATNQRERTANHPPPIENGNNHDPTPPTEADWETVSEEDEDSNSDEEEEETSEYEDIDDDYEDYN